jgi:hypothetical protein
VFRKEGEFWTLAYGDKLVRLGDTKGFSYIVYLLRNPGAEFHALDLIGGTVGPARRDSESENPESVVSSRLTEVTTTTQTANANAKRLRSGGW